MKIMFNRKIVDGPWGGGNLFVKNMYTLLKSKGHHICFDFEDNIDIIFMIDPRQVDVKEGYSVDDIIEYGSKFPDAEIIHRVNECDKRKGTDFMDSLLLESNRIADYTVFNSQWLADYFLERGFDRNYSVIYNGCDTDIFYPNQDKVGCSNPVRLVTHHWSDNWMKGFDIYNALDEFVENRDIEFTYIGRYNKEYTPKNINIIPPINGLALGEELRKYDVYITASRFEPCGNHFIEGSASGLPILYHKDGGGMKEFCEPHGIEFHDMDSLFNGLETIIHNYDKFVSGIDYEYLSNKRMCDQYYKEFIDE